MYAYAKWLAETVTAGPVGNKKILIEQGEVRKIKAKSSDGYYILEGLNREGSFGWVNPEEIQLLESKDG